MRDMQRPGNSKTLLTGRRDCFLEESRGETVFGRHLTASRRQNTSLPEGRWSLGRYPLLFPIEIDWAFNGAINGLFRYWCISHPNAFIATLSHLDFIIVFRVFAYRSVVGGTR